jgi:hypothetical protein
LNPILLIKTRTSKNRRNIYDFSTYRSNNEMFTSLFCVIVFQQSTKFDVYFVIFHSVCHECGGDKQQYCPNCEHDPVLATKCNNIQPRSPIINCTNCKICKLVFKYFPVTGKYLAFSHLPKHCWENITLSSYKFRNVPFRMKCDYCLRNGFVF